MTNLGIEQRSDATISVGSLPDPLTATDGARGAVLRHLQSAVLDLADRAPLRPSVPGLRIYVERQPTAAVPVVFEPVLYVVLQGEKQLLLDDRVVRYDESTLVIATMSLPALAQVLRASPDKPYLAVEVRLDREMLTALMAEVGAPPGPTTEALSVHAAPTEIFDPLHRLLRLARDPMAARLFAADAVRELAYRVMIGPHGAALRQMATFRSPLERVAEASSIMAAHLHDPLDIPDVARHAGTSVATLNRHFRAATGDSPLVYYKRLRLHEARRLGVSRTLNVTEAAAAVGYVSAAHFSRDYRRVFGVTPSWDFGRLRAV